MTLSKIVPTIQDSTITRNVVHLLFWNCFGFRMQG